MTLASHTPSAKGVLQAPLNDVKCVGYLLASIANVLGGKEHVQRYIQNVKELEEFTSSVWLLQEEILQRLKRRGPDHMREVTMPTVLGGSTSLELILVGTLLRMRGEATPQPVRHGNGNQFLWNGNIFGGQIEVRTCIHTIGTLIIIYLCFFR